MQKGFTLIVLMTVVAIIGVLAAVAVPAYQDYIAKSQTTAGLAEIKPSQAQIESYGNTGVYPSTTTAGTTDTTAASLLPYGFSAASSTRCTYSLKVISASTNNVIVQCVLKGAGTIANKKIQLTRSADSATAAGTWTCNTDLDAKYLPVGCLNAATTPAAVVATL
jgi:type IV pilus assembly protein PilA